MAGQESCCPPGSLPGLEEDANVALLGSVEVVDGRAVYYSPPPEASTKGVVVLYDVHGFSGGRIKGVCDALASKGFHVVMPDVFEGSNIKTQGGFSDEKAMAWLKAMSAESVDRIAPAFSKLSAVGAKSVGAIGFCWGAYPTFKLSAAGLIKAGAACHPSLKLGNMFFGETEEAQAAAAMCHMMLMPASNDDDRYRDGTLSKIVEANGFEARVRDFPDMQHGWVPRGDATLPDVKRDVEVAIREAAAFFQKHL
ncbi:dienelactone hydrolase [Pelagophyceae sp. CCMP2097]|nr:dienelactone hydrolase [Pelagophyceae sp. CCMP2097]